MNFQASDVGRPVPKFPAAWLAAGISMIAATATAQTTVQSVVDTFGNAAVQGALSTGVEVAVITGSAPPQFFSYGVADTATLAPPTSTTLFYVGSLSKVFTTNLLAQSVDAGTHSLTETLGAHTAELGPLSVDTSAVTFAELGDFTAGYPNLAPMCLSGQTPGTNGCLPTMDPGVGTYDAPDFAKFFDTYQLPGLPPTGYSYSTFGVGLLGLLLGDTPGVPLTNAALGGYNLLLQSELTTPLRLRSTYLTLPAGATDPLASGYQQAEAGVTLSRGGISAIKLTNRGAGYLAPPVVTITGGGGTGASATASINALGGVSNIRVTSPGSGYIENTHVSFSGGGATFTKAKGTVIVQNGAVIGVLLSNAGLSYTSSPTVSFSGGRIGGRDAVGIAHVSNGGVTYVTITDGGAGYVQPLVVAVAPGSPAVLVTPIWAPASSILSNAADMASFAAAALGHATIGTVAVPPAITQAFALAETPMSCKDKHSALQGCTGEEAGLAWRINPYPPSILDKDGAVNGFSTYLVMMPSADTAVVVLTNSFNGTGEATNLGNGILYSLYYAGLLP